MVAENRQQHIYCGPSDQCQSSSHTTQLEELYMSNMGSGLPGYGHRYLHYYPQFPSSTIQYCPAELEGPKKSTKKQITNKETCSSKTKSVGNNQRGYQAGLGSSLPLGGSSLWGLYPDSAIGSLSGSSNGYEFYSQQWHSSAQGFQPIPPPQVGEKSFQLFLRGIFLILCFNL